MLGLKVGGQILSVVSSSQLVAPNGFFYVYQICFLLLLFVEVQPLLAPPFIYLVSLLLITSSQIFTIL